MRFCLYCVVKPILKLRDDEENSPPINWGRHARVPITP